MEENNEEPVSYLPLPTDAPLPPPLVTEEKIEKLETELSLLRNELAKIMTKPNRKSHSGGASGTVSFASEMPSPPSFIPIEDLPPALPTAFSYMESLPPAWEAPLQHDNLEAPFPEDSALLPSSTGPMNPPPEPLVI